MDIVAAALKNRTLIHPPQKDMTAALYCAAGRRSALLLLSSGAELEQYTAGQRFMAKGQVECAESVTLVSGGNRPDLGEKVGQRHVRALDQGRPGTERSAPSLRDGRRLRSRRWSGRSYWRFRWMRAELMHKRGEQSQFCRGRDGRRVEQHSRYFASGAKNQLGVPTTRAAPPQRPGRLV
jgi:hypothetical protein